MPRTLRKTPRTIHLNHATGSAIVACGIPITPPSRAARATVHTAVRANVTCDACLAASDDDAKRRAAGLIPGTPEYHALIDASADAFQSMVADERARDALVAACRAALASAEVAHANGHTSDGGCTCTILRAALKLAGVK